MPLTVENGMLVDEQVLGVVLEKIRRPSLPPEDKQIQATGLSAKSFTWGTAEAAFFLLTRHQVQLSAFPKIYFDVAEIYRQHRLEDSGQRLNNVD